MSRPRSGADVRALLGRPGVARAFTATTVGRLAYGMISLSLLLVVQRATASYATAGTAIGLYGLATLSAPSKSRLVGRHGRRAVIPPLALACGAALGGLVLLAGTGRHGPLPPLALSAAAGLAAPPLGPAMRDVWSRVTEGADELARAYGIDVATEEVTFTAGPLLVGGLVALGGPTPALAVTAACLVVGALLLGATPATTAPSTAATSSVAATTSPATQATAATSGADGGTSSLLRRPGLLPLLAVVAAASMGTSAIDVTVTARAVQHHQGAAAGWVLAALAVGSALGGLGWGRIHHRRRTSTQIIALLVSAAAGTALAAVTPDLVLLAVVLAATGLVLTPALILDYLVAGRVGGSRSAEATAWVNTAGNAGLALGAGLTGFAVDRAGTALPLLAGAAVLLATAAVVAGQRVVYDGHHPGPIGRDRR